MTKLLIASNNEGKVEEIRELFKGLNYKIVSMKDIGINIHVEEDQPDFTGNSFKKAKEVSAKTGQIVLADDSGLEVEALKGQPGVYSARFAGETARDSDNNNKLLSLMKEIPEKRRRARFRCVITIYWPDGTYFQTEGTCLGKIGYEPIGEGGFGYDPLFLPTGFNKSMAELTADEKNKISHRAIAIKLMVKLLSKK
ncbi:MAG: XTP/dITP diphosphatase [Clostridiales bacterium]|jgi:XTP/dITP diphosphohydrolase|nr:XTP/dITP diphosphatase [Clostridiales bacterium]